MEKLKLTSLEKLVAGVISSVIGIAVAKGLVNYGEDILMNFNKYMMAFPSYTQNFIDYIGI